MRGRAALVLAVVALAGCSQDQSDHFSRDIGDILLTLLLIALVVVLVVVVLVAIGAGLLTRGLAGLRRKQPPPPAWPPPGTSPYPPPGTPAQPPLPPPADDSRSWAYVVAGTVLLLIAGPTFAQIFIGRGLPAGVVELAVLALVVGAVALIRRGPPTMTAAPPPPLIPPGMPPPQMPPPPATPAPATPAPEAANADRRRPRRPAPLRATRRDPGEQPPRPPD